MTEKVLSTLEEQVQPEHTALIVVDPQNDFCATDGAVISLMGWDASRIQKAVEPLNRFIEKARRKGLLIVWTRSFVDPTRARSSFVARTFIANAKAREITLVKEGLNGADWYSGVTKPMPDEHVITKYHYDAFEDTDLDLLLKSQGIKTILLTGFIANVCVETTGRHGYIKGYYPVLVTDCTEAATQQEYDSTVFNLGTYFGKAATSEHIVKIWSGIGADQDNQV
jgi:ureidoacrylate peracid hydrolase